MNLINRASRNFTFKLIGEVGSRFLAMFFYIIIARKLGTAVFGRYSFAYAFSAIFVILMDLGVNTVLIRDLSRLNDKKNIYINNINILKLVLSVITWVIIHITITILNYPKDVVSIVDLMACIAIGTGMIEYICAIFNAFEQMQYESMLKIVNKILFFIFGVGALFIGLSLKGLIKGLILAYLITIIIGFFYVHKKITPIRFNFDFKFCYKIIKFSLPIFLSVIFLTVYKNLDVVFLSLFNRPDQEIGWYTAVVKLGDVLRAIPVLSVGAVFPIFASLALDSREKLKKSFVWLIKLLCLFSIPLAFGTTILSEKIILFIYGANYLPAAIILSISIWAFIFIFINHAFIQVLVIVDKQKINVISSAIVVLINIGLNVVLILNFGYLGPPFALLIAEIIFFFINIYFISIFFMPIHFESWMWKVIVASMIMGAILFFLNQYQLSFFVLVIIGSVVYGCLLLILKILSPEDIGFVKKLVRLR